MTDKELLILGPGPSFLSLLTLLLIGLKLTGYISYPWYIVLLPMWGPMAIGLLVLAIAFIVSYWVNRE